jgi:hypothetical protein
LLYDDEDCSDVCENVIDRNLTYASAECGKKTKCWHMPYAGCARRKKGRRKLWNEEWGGDLGGSERDGRCARRVDALGEKWVGNIEFGAAMAVVIVQKKYRV